MTCEGFDTRNHFVSQRLGNVCKNWAVNWPSRLSGIWDQGITFPWKTPWASECELDWPIRSQPWHQVTNERAAQWHANLCPNSHWVVPALCDIYNVWYKDIKHNLHPTRLGWERVNIDFNRFIKISQRWEELPWGCISWWDHKNFSDWKTLLKSDWMNILRWGILVKLNFRLFQ